MLLLTKKTFDVAVDGPRVAADEAAVVARAEEVIAAAEAEAAQIREEAKGAFAAKKERGYKAGLAAGKAEILMQKLNLVDESVRYMESIELKVSDIVMKALRKCVAEIGDTELVVQIVHKAMQAVVRNQRQITVRVNPAMVPVVKGRVAELLAEFPSLSFIEVAEDAHLDGAACVVETEAGLVEASVEGQLAALEKSIRKHFAKEDGSRFP